MIKTKHQLRFGKDLYLVESVMDNQYLLKNLRTNVKGWCDTQTISKSLVKIVFENYHCSNDGCSISLLNNNVNTIAKIIVDNKCYYKCYNNYRKECLKEFSNDFKYFNEITPQKLERKGFTTNKPKIYKKQQLNESKIIDKIYKDKPNKILSAWNYSYKKHLKETDDYNNDITNSERQQFLDIVENHNRLVNMFASKVGKSYPNHDQDKFSDDILIPYVKGFVRGDLTNDEKQEFRNAQLKHYKNNAHHPEHWDNSQIPNVSQKMPDDAIIEMCADWCAMSEVFENSPIDWANNNIGKRWIFDEHQTQLIYDTLEKMWEN